MPSDASVSVVIPTYNNAEFIGTALRSVFLQTIQPVEIIVVDDGSEDGTEEMMRQFKDRVQYMRQRRGGPASARNRGILAARGDWIALLDADDMWLPERLEREINVAVETNADLVFCDARSMTREGEPTNVTRFGQYKLNERFAETGDSRLLWEPFKLLFEAGCYILPSAVLVRRDVVVDAGMFDDKIYCNEDMDLWMRLAMDRRFAVVPEALVLRRIHGKNISADFYTVVTGELKVCESLRARAPEVKAFDWRALLARKEAALYRQLASLQFDREDIRAARESLRSSLRRSLSLRVFVYLTVSYLPRGLVAGLRNWKLNGRKA